MAAKAAFDAYLEALASHGGATITVDELPDEPELLSYIIAVAVIVDLAGQAGAARGAGRRQAASSGARAACAGERGAAGAGVAAGAGSAVRRFQP